MKREFLAVYDYGTGGIWVVLRARTAEEVSAAFPELQVVEARPHWLTDGEYQRITADMMFDIDAPPTGWLAKLVAGREVG